MSRRQLLLACAFVVAVLAAYHYASLTWVSGPVGPCVLIGKPARLPELPEASGLAVSRRTPGMLWSHNDSGNDQVLFALAPDGTLRGRVRVPVTMSDWEDVSAGPCPSGDCLYLADIGDNQARRRQIVIYRVSEPAAGDRDTAIVDAFPSTYADEPHNAEALFVLDARFFIVTKDRTGNVYRSREGRPGGAPLTFERVGELRLPAVSDAETSADGRFVVVRTSDEVALYGTDEIRRNVFTPALRFSLAGLREAQGEGVALEGNQLFLSGEGWLLNRPGRMMTLRCDLREAGGDHGSAGIG